MVALAIRNCWSNGKRALVTMALATGFINNSEVTGVSIHTPMGLFFRSSKGVTQMAGNTIDTFLCHYRTDILNSLMAAQAPLLHHFFELRGNTPHQRGIFLSSSFYSSPGRREKKR
jgi:hypothetical protein